MVTDPSSLPLALVHFLRQHRQFPQGLLQGGVVRVGGASVLEEVLHEEYVTRDALDWLDQQVVQTQLPLAVSSTLLRR